MIRNVLDPPAFRMKGWTNGERLEVVITISTRAESFAAVVARIYHGQAP